MKKNIYQYLLIPALAVFAFACDNEELTGESSLTKTSPTVSISIPNGAASFVEKDSTFEFVIELDAPQISDVAIYVSQIDGDATEGEDFTIGTPVVIIPATRTRGVASVSVKADAVPEATETFVIQIGDDRTGNAAVQPQTVTFTIANVSDGDLALDLSWDVEYYDATGEEIAATDVANLVLLITDLEGEVVESADGSGFESFVIDSELPDGEYLIKAGITGRLEPGDLGVPPMLGLTLDYAQAGVIEPTTLNFPAVFNSAQLCDGNTFILASLVKDGENFTITEVGETTPPPPTPGVGTFGGIDAVVDGFGFTGTADVVITENNGTYFIEGLNVDFMENVWGETVEESAPVELTLAGDGTFTIEDQYIFTTMYEGDLYEYHITGSGSIDACGNITVNYEMNQDGFLVGNWLHTNGPPYMADEMFKAVLTME